MIKSFYKWFYDSINEDMEEASKPKREVLYLAYTNTINNFNVDMEIDIIENYFKLLNNDNKSRINKILEIIKHEHKLIKDYSNKDIIYCNDILGWYKKNSK